MTERRLRARRLRSVPPGQPRGRVVLLLLLLLGGGTTTAAWLAGDPAPLRQGLAWGTLTGAVLLGIVSIDRAWSGLPAPDALPPSPRRTRRRGPAPVPSSRGRAGRRPVRRPRARAARKRSPTF